MFLENIKEAITSIFSNKMRSILTMLGIIIGISAVITITTIGNSIQTTLTSTLNSLGGNTVQAYVDARYPEDDADWDTWEYPEMKTSDFVTQEMIDELVEKYPDEFDGIAASEFLGNGQIRQDKNTYANVSVQGTTSEYIDYMKLKMYAGRNLTKQDYGKIAALMLDEMKEPLSERNISLTYDQKALDAVAEKSYSKKFGARDIRRIIRSEIEDKIAEIIIDNSEKVVNNISVSADNNDISVKFSE